MILDQPAPRLHVYPVETVIAEKLEAMVTLGIANSRMKDFYDLVIISERITVDGKTLVQAIRNTFERRGTKIPFTMPIAFSAEFSTDRQKQAQWKAFVYKNELDAPRKLEDVIVRLECFLKRPLVSARKDGNFTGIWVPEKEWKIPE